MILTQHGINSIGPIQVPSEYKPIDYVETDGSSYIKDGKSTVNKIFHNF